MDLKFDAQEVTYTEALDGDLVQLIFQEEPDPEFDYSKENQPIPPLTKYVMISANYEFPPCDATVEWSDGDDYDGMKLIKDIELTKARIKMVLENGCQIDVRYKTDDITFNNIKKFLLSDEG